MVDDSLPKPSDDRWRLDGRVAVVTGGASGIGLACAEAVARAGARVALTDRDGGAAKRAADGLVSLRLAVEAHQMDVGEESAVDATVSAIAGRHGRLDILVNNAGTGARMPTE